MYKVTQKARKQHGTRKTPACQKTPWASSLSSVLLFPELLFLHRSLKLIKHGPGKGILHRERKRCTYYDVHSCSPHHKAPGEEEGAAERRRLGGTSKMSCWCLVKWTCTQRKMVLQNKNKNKIHVKKKKNYTGNHWGTGQNRKKYRARKKATT